MSTKFFEEFTMRSEGEFDMLKLNSATYYKEKRELVVKFIISAFEVQEFGDDKKSKVLDIIKSMFSGVDVSVQYIRTYADAGVVKNKVLEFFNRTNQMIFRRINDNTLKIDIGEKDVDVKLIFETPTYKMLMAGDILDKLHTYLDCNFNYNIDILTDEIVQSADEIIGSEEMHIDTTMQSNGDSGLRLVEIRTGEKIYSRGRIEGISQMPNYIADIKGACDNIVLCGHISGIEKKSYKNKKYDPDNAKSGPETLPFVKFYIDDTTQKMECVCFANKDEDIQSLIALNDGDNVACMGKVSWSQYANAWSYMVSAVFDADINYDSIHLASAKPVPTRYTTVFPQEYVDIGQKSLLDSAEKPIPQYLMGKSIVVFDLETTGLQTDSCEIIELAALKMIDGKEVETFQTLIKPIGPVSEEITNITHITNAMLLDAPNIESVFPDFYRFAHDSILAGHNIAGYDFPIINRIAGEMGYRCENELLDTLLLARKYLDKELSSFKLENISKHFGITHDNAHRAMSDVYATAQTLKIIAGRI